MNKKFKKFIKEYRNALILAGCLCIPLFICLYLFVPKNSTSPEVTPLADNESIIFDALDGNGSVTCVFTGETTGNAYIKSGNVKLITDSQTILYRKDKVYIWDDSSSSGKLIDIEKIPLAKSFINQDEISKQIGKYQPTCKSQNLQEDLFRIPTKVKFENYTPSMGDIMSM